MSRISIHELAYDGNLEEVKKYLAENPALLNAEYAVSSALETTALQITAGFLFGTKKFVGAVFVWSMFFTGAGPVIVAPQVIVMATGFLSSLAYTAWTLGDERFLYYTKDKTGFTPLHCAALGYANGNKNALDVAIYLIEEGANTDTKISGVTFLDLGDDLFKSKCNNAITRKNDTDAEINRLRQYEQQVSRLVPMGVDLENGNRFFMLPREQNTTSVSAQANVH